MIMATYVNRQIYLQKLIHRRDNGEVKIITGTRRCGKSWLLKKVYHDYLVSQGVPKKNIIMVSFDVDEDITGEDLTNPMVLKRYLYSKIIDEDASYYVFLDEIQMVEGFERIVNGLNAHDNVDVYITGSNSKFLSSDINTIFRGRGDEVRVYPFSFKEFCTDRSDSINELWKEYYTYGGMPALRNHPTPEQKVSYLQRLWQKTYFDDVVERNGIKNRVALECLVDSLCSSIGSLTNPSKIRNTLESVQHVKLDADTVSSYIQCLENAFLFEGARRYNVKGRKYYESIKKYYVVDVGVVESRVMRDGKSTYQQYEIDFIATNGLNKYYIQSAYSLPTEEKREQELASLKKIDDSFRKIIIVGDDIATYMDANGYVFMGLFQFLKNEDVME